MAEADNELPIDLDNVLAVDTLVELVMVQERATLVELFSGSEQLCVHGPEGRFVHELVVPFVRRGAAAVQPRAGAAERSRQALSLSARGQAAADTSAASVWLTGCQGPRGRRWRPHLLDRGRAANAHSLAVGGDRFVDRLRGDAGRHLPDRFPDAGHAVDVHDAARRQRHTPPKFGPVAGPTQCRSRGSS